MDKLASLGKKTTNVIVGNLIGKGLSFVSLFVVSRLFGASLYGQYTYVFTAVFLFSILTRFGYSSSILYFFPRYAAQDQRQADGVITRSILVVALSSLVFAAVFWLLREPVVEKLLPQAAGAAFVWFVLLFMTHNVYYLAVQILRALRREWLFVLMQTVGYELLKIILLIGLFLLFRASLAVLAASFTLVFAILAAGCLLYLFHAGQLRLWHFSRTENRQHWRYSLKSMMTTAFNMIENKIDILFLGFLTTTALVGVYRVTFQISTLVPFAFTSFLTMLTPLVAELYAKNQHEDMYHYLRTITKWSSVFGLFIVGLITLFARDLLSLFGPEFTAGSLALVILAFSKIMLFMTGPTAALLSMTGRPELNLYARLIVIVVNVGLNLLLIPRYGLIGATLATLLAVLLSNIFSVGLVRIIHKVYLFSADTLKSAIPFSLALLICLPVRFILPDRIVWKAVALVLYLAVFGLALRKMPRNQYDRILLTGMTKNLKRLLRKKRRLAAKTARTQKDQPQTNEKPERD